MSELKDDQSRRAFVKKAAYVAPAIISLKAVPAFASNGSAWSRDGAADVKDDDKAARAAARDARKAAREAAKAARQVAKGKST